MSKEDILKAARTGKVSSGIPSLDAMKRYTRDRHDYQRMKTEQAVADAHMGKQSLYQKDGHLDPTNDEQMKGKAYTAKEIMQKLQKLNRKLHFERSNAFPDLIGIYIEHPKGEYKGWMHLMGMPDGEVTQYSVRKPDLTGKRLLIEKRGWMKLLVDLARIGVINLEAARRVFDTAGHQSRNFAVLTGAR